MHFNAFLRSLFAVVLLFVEVKEGAAGRLLERQSVFVELISSFRPSSLPLENIVASFPSVPVCRKIQKFEPQARSGL